MSSRERHYHEWQEEVIKIPVKQLGELHRLPLCVELVACLPPPNSNGSNHIPERNEWAYIHIRSPYSPVRAPGAFLTYTTWDTFLDKISEFLRTDLEKTTTARNLYGTHA